MVSTSKILTVSYGTFSCTLEGFDDSFDTMKAIAEYFRDLAADDRYFGAEPPTPDAEMLARIAEKEIARRVEAHEDAGKIHLRAEESAAAPTTATTAPAMLEDSAAQTDAVENVTAQAETDTDDSTTKEQLVDATSEDVAEPEPAEEDVVTASVAETIAAVDTDADDVQDEQLEPVVSENDLPEDVLSEDALGDAEAPTELEDAAPSAEDDLPQMAVAEASDDPIEPTVALADDIDDDAITASIESAMANMDDTSAADAAEVIEEDAELDAAAFEDDELVADHSLDEVSSEDEAVAQSEEDDDDSVAARLRRIRSVVARGGSELAPSSFSEDEHAQDFLNDTVSSLDAALMADAPEQQDGGVESESAVAIDTAEDADFDTVPETAFDAADGDTEASEDTDITDLAEDTLSQLLADAIPEEDNAAALDGEIEDDMTAEDTPLRARVIKMKRSDFEAAVAGGALEETFDLLEEDQHDTAEDDEPAEAILSPEDEADLQSELDAVAAELEADIQFDNQNENEAPEMPDAAAAASDIAEDEAKEEHADAAFDDESYDEDDEDLARKSQMLGESDRPISRLFDEAQSHLSSPEASRRRNAIQHLRAAVEANTAETKAGSELLRGADEGAYRDDIADVMRTHDAEDTVDAQRGEDGTPTRPRTRRPIESRPAPLKLVAEQRVDMPQDPVRPRRVSTAQLTDPIDLPSDAGSFNDFAEDIGATELSDLIEAAAAYVADVEGRPQFSRRTLMGKLDEVATQEFSREDRLKSFGQLIRHGKLQKLKGGWFTVTEETDFRDKTRDAG